MSQEAMKWDAIINDLKNGNNEVLRIFFQKHATYCISRLTNENQCSKADAEDIFVDAIMSLREKLIEGTLDKVINERNYLYKTCYNMFLVRHRSNKKIDGLSDDITRFYYDSKYQSEETETITEELMKITLSAWAHLTEKCKDILHFFYVDKLRMEEISKLMGLSNADVAKSTKARCYKSFVEKAMQLKELESISTKE